MTNKSTQTLMPSDEAVAFDPLEMRSRFENLVRQWKQETGHLSNVTKKCISPAYQRIIGMGQPAIPLILRELREHGGDWFWALTAITGENPISNNEAGRIPQMVEAWVQWGAERGYLSDCQLESKHVSPTSEIRAT